MIQFFLLKKSPPRLLTIAWSISFIILLAIALRSIQTKMHLGRQVKAHAQEQLDFAINAANKELQIPMMLAQSIADEYASGKLPKEALKERLQEELKKHPTLFGLGAAFAPFAFDEKKKLHAPYFMRIDHTIQFRPIEQSYDYTQPEVQNGPRTNWYHNPLKQGAMWNEPFYAQVSKTDLVEYAVPIQYKRKTIGIIFASYRPATLKAFLSSLDLGQSGYAFMLSPKGRFVAHPIEKYMKKQRTIFSLAQKLHSTSLSTLGMKAIKKSQGMYDYRDPLTGEETWAFFSKIPASGWTLVINFVKDEIFAAYDTTFRRQKIQLLLALILFLILGAIILTRAFKGQTKHLWLCSYLSASFCVIGIGYLWHLARKVDLSPQQKGAIVIDEVTLKKIIPKKAMLHAVPTGLVISHLMFTDAHTIKFNGYLWRKFSKKFEKSIPTDLFFPASISSSLQEVYRHTNKETVTIGWNFVVSLRQQFNYAKFPLDHKHIAIQLKPKTGNLPTIATPDFDAYPLINPLSRPGLIANFDVAGWKPESSFFSYQKIDYKSNLGIAGAKERKKELFFNIVLNRNFIDPFISYVIPLFVILFLLFISVLLSREYPLWRTLSVASGLLFAIIIAHISLRGKFPQQPLFYLEMFYILTYFMLILYMIEQTLHSFGIKIPLLHTKNNLGTQLLYWPFFLGSLLLITAYTFY